MSPAYIAGFIDGEGCIQFSKSRMSIFPRIIVVNTNREILEDLKQQYGGDIKSICHRHVGWKSSWQWRVSWSSALRLLDDIYPYLRLKRLQALAIYAWLYARPEKGERWDQPSLQLLVDYMHWLNKKGINNDPDPVDIVLEDINRLVL